MRIIIGKCSMRISSEKGRVAIRFKVVSERKKTYRRVRAAFSVHRIRATNDKTTHYHSTALVL